MRAARRRAGGLDRGFDGRDPTERLAHRVDGDEPARAPAARDEALRRNRSSARRTVTRLVPYSGRELDLARQRAAGADAAGGDPGPQRVGEVEVPHDLYCTCLRSAQTSAPRGQGPWNGRQASGSAVFDVTDRGSLPAGEIGERRPSRAPSAGSPAPRPRARAGAWPRRRTRGPGAGRPAPRRAGPRPPAARRRP